MNGRKKNKPNAAKKPSAVPPRSKQSSKGVGKKHVEAAAAPAAVRVPRPVGSFPIAGVGASAGGLEALRELFESMPVDTGIAFVVVTHQHPDHPSLLPELLARSTKLPVSEAKDGTRVQPDHVYVGPPGGYLDVLGGRLHRMEFGGQETRHLPIDHFFRSLAQERKEKAIAVILSGTGTDGTLGLKAIKGESGMVMAQQVQSAKYAGMPGSAIATDQVDFILPPKAMPAQLARYARRPSVTKARGKPDESREPEMPDEPLQKVLVLLRARTGHDFSGYKVNTIRRRIERRLNLHQIRDPEHYLRYLQENPHELDILFKELLISVTSFFRDEEAYESLGACALPELLKSRPDKHVFRVWVPGCATGEEVYSLAILLRECQLASKHPFDVQIFGTDLDATAIDLARTGRYSEGISADITHERLERFFRHEENGWRVRKVIREMAIFAVQNAIKDPPFTKLDLISCRNLLIYLGADLQKKLMSLFHYALRPGGLLFLGPSETTAGAADLFEVVDKKWKIYRRKEVPPALRSPVEFPTSSTRDQAGPPTQTEPRPAREPQKMGGAVERLLLGRFVPASVVVNERGDVLFIHGRTGQFLEPPAGQPQMNIHQMAREGLQIELASALREAVLKDEPVERENIRVRTNGHFEHVDFCVQPITEPESLRDLFLIVFRAARPAPVPPKQGGTRAAEKVRETALRGRLENELRHMKESLQNTIEELETSNEELKSTNEELQSTNEELQSTNEELETSKEEMQSLNEELTTVNAELNAKVDELSRANDDMQNLLNSTEVATIFLDCDLKISRYTERALHLVNLIQSDIGRPLGDLASRLNYDRLVQDCREVLRTLVFKERDLQTKDGQWFLMRIIPYRTAENLIDGLVLTFVDINPVKKAERELAATKERLAGELDAMTRLHNIGALYIQQAGTNEIIAAVLNAAIAITAAPFGHVQVCDANTHKPGIRAHYGFRKDCIDAWADAEAAQGACGSAAKRRERVIVEDITQSPLFAGTRALEAHREAGTRSVQCTPVLARDGHLLGLISTHHKQSHRPDHRALRLLDMLARITGDILERAETNSPPAK